MSNPYPQQLQTGVLVASELRYRHFTTPRVTGVPTSKPAIKVWYAMGIEGSLSVSDTCELAYVENETEPGWRSRASIHHLEASPKAKHWLKGGYDTKAFHRFSHPSS